MKSISYLSITFWGCMFLSSCESDGVSPCKPATTIKLATKKVVGHWQLTAIKSGWTGQVTAPSDTIDLVINPQQQVVVLKNGKEAERHQLVLTDSQTGYLRFTLTTTTPATGYGLVNQSGLFQVCDSELILDNTWVDGPAQTFTRK